MTYIKDFSLPKVLTCIIHWQINLLIKFFVAGKNPNDTGDSF